MDLLGLIEVAAGSSTPDWQSKVVWLEDQYNRCRIGGGSGEGGGDGACARAAGPGVTAAAAGCAHDAAARLAWLLARGYFADGSAVHAALRAGNAEALRLLLAGSAAAAVGAGAPSTAFLPGPVMMAVDAGHQEALQVLHSHGRSPLDVDKGLLASACRRAATRGHLQLLAWLLGLYGGPRAPAARELLPGLTEAAAQSGSVELLAWLVGQCGGPLNKRVFLAAAAAGCAEALEWLAARGCVMGGKGNAYVRAARNGDLATLRCLAQLRVPWGPGGSVFSRCAGGNAFAPCARPVLAFLLELGCPVDWDEAMAAAEDRADGVPAWLAERRAAAAAEEELAAAPRWCGLGRALRRLLGGCGAGRGRGGRDCDTAGPASRGCARRRARGARWLD
ncbi:hypothetical protein GPECTOR_68g386 [Gonium pectorale]|uniref:Uncharacterized protein n=1 Tax=Gonium pectorale TaxID=33097 RepID=A0A150G3L1_GONPE|nr:hypothetical protein GPECTOR_68g386 [Gonium pectorale]|eukprot:KXZ44414.1 hypothetical protein GPECTOR_68g386 [Gonium pectorale]